MFANNDRISQRQLLRQMVLSLLGAWLLALAGGVSEHAQNGVLGLILGFSVLAVWILLLLQIFETRERMTKRTGKTGIVVLALLYVSFLIFTGSFLLRKVGQICEDYLVSGIDEAVLGLFLLLAAGAGMGNDIQRRARLAEIFYPFVMGGFLLMLFLSAFHMRPESFLSPAKLSVSVIAKDAWEILGAGTVLMVLPFVLGQVDGQKRLKKPLLEGLGKLWLLLLAAVLILLGTFGVEGIRQMKQPVLQLMAGTRLTGEFLERFDIIWLALLLCSILFALGSILFYAGQIARSCKGTGRSLRWVTGFLIYLFSLLGGKEDGIFTWYPNLVQWFYLPAFLLLTLIFGLWSWKQRRKMSGSKEKAHERQQSEQEA